MSDGNATQKKTPYQGQKRTFGEFGCPKCKNIWHSANSWANTAQTCTKCKADVYPSKQAPLKKSSENYKSDPDKHHPQDLCGKCRTLGRFCGQKYRS